LKAVLLNEENGFPSIPLAHAVHRKERYEREKLQDLLQKCVMKNMVEYMS